MAKLTGRCFGPPFEILRIDHQHISVYGPNGEGMAWRIYEKPWVGAVIDGPYLKEAEGGALHENWPPLERQIEKQGILGKMAKITRFGFFGGLLASLAAYAQTKIEACAPVYYKMPKPCEGQCPACGLAHGEATIDLIQNGEWELFGLHAISFACTHCRNIFQRPVAEAVWDEWHRSAKP